MKIIGTGSYLPERVLNNDDLSKIVDTSDEWITPRTGIKERRISSGEENSDMTCEAGKRAIEDAGIKPEEIDLIIVATITSEYITPGVSCLVQEKLGAYGCMCMDLNAACAGFVYALNTANCYMEAGMASTALVIGVENLSKITDYTDRATCVLFGDAAGAVVVRKDNTKKYRACLGADAHKWRALTCKNLSVENVFVKKEQKRDYLHMDGQEVFKFVVKVIPKVIRQVLEKENLTENDIDYYLLHQANRRINETVAKKLKVDFEEKFPMNIEKTGNTSSATVPVLLDQLNKEGKFKEGDKLILCAFGGGLTWGCALVEW